MAIEVNENFFNKTYPKKAIVYINSLLKNDKLSDDQKAKLLYILNFLCYENFINIIDICKSVAQFCTDENNISNSHFDDLLDNIIDAINSCDNDNEKKLRNRIITLFHGRSSKLRLTDDEWYELLIEILNMKSFESEYGNFDLIKKLLNKPIDGHPKKTKIAIEVALNNIVDIIPLSKCEKVGTYGEDTYDYVFGIFKNNMFLELDDEYFKRALKIAYNGIKSVFLGTVLSCPFLSLKKIRAIIDYYGVICEKYMKLYRWCNSSMISKKFDIAAYNIPFCSKFLDMDDETFKEKLNMISGSSVPFSMARVLASDMLTGEQEDIVLLELDTKNDKNIIDYDEENDSKSLLVDAAFSLVLRSQTIEEYKRILKIVNGYLHQYAIISGRYDERKLIFLKLDGIVNMLKNDKLYINNYNRFLFVLNTIMSINNVDIVKFIMKFATNDSSIYYSDTGFKRIINLIISSEHRCCITELFLNKNVPYMNEFDINLMFVAAYNGNEKEIESLTNDLNEKGQKNSNIDSMFNGVRKEVLTRLKVRIPRKRSVDSTDLTS